MDMCEFGTIGYQNISETPSQKYACKQADLHYLVPLSGMQEDGLIRCFHLGRRPAISPPVTNHIAGNFGYPILLALTSLRLWLAALARGLCLFGYQYYQR